MMNRWTTMKTEMAKGGGGKFGDRRPYLASECKTISEAEKWRRQIIGELTRKVAEIQNGEQSSYLREREREIVIPLPHATPATRQLAWVNRVSVTLTTKSISSCVRNSTGSAK